MAARYTAASSWYQDAPSATTAAQPAAYSTRHGGDLHRVVPGPPLQQAIPADQPGQLGVLAAPARRPSARADGRHTHTHPDSPGSSSSGSRARSCSSWPRRSCHHSFAASWSSRGTRSRDRRTIQVVPLVAIQCACGPGAGFRVGRLGVGHGVRRHAQLGQPGGEQPGQQPVPALAGVQPVHAPHPLVVDGRVGGHVHVHHLVALRQLAEHRVDRVSPAGQRPPQRPGDAQQQPRVGQARGEHQRPGPLQGRDDDLLQVARRSRRGRTSRAACR